MLHVLPEAEIKWLDSYRTIKYSIKGLREVGEYKGLKTRTCINLLNIGTNFKI